ncbi:hypothetical protein [Paraburkholderia sp. RL17-373-BIF-A]|uniref:hypothetical protein n=1 Tax=Paraburkholderia sp. RL17-373-BIF-A TaxID=3031629 RepID=UPI0038BB9991
MITGYAGWTEVAGTNATIAVEKLTNPDDHLGESVEVSTGLSGGGNAFALAEIAFTLTDFVMMEAKGARIAANLKALDNDVSIVGVGDNEPLYSVEHDIAKQELSKFQDGRLSRLVTCARDGVVQLGKVILNILIAVKNLLVTHGIEILSGLTKALGTILTAAFSIGMGALHVVAGVVDYIRSRRDGKASREVVERVSTCFGEDSGKIDLCAMGKSGSDVVERAQKYSTKVTNIQSLSDESALKLELNHVTEVYTVLGELAQSKHNTIAKAADRTAAFSIARVVFGAASVTVGVLILVGVTIPFVGAVIGAFWLGFAVYKMAAGLQAKRAEVARVNAESKTLNRYVQSSLIDVERDFIEDADAHGCRKVAAAILVEHLSGGKREVSGASKDAMAVERANAYNETKSMNNVSPAVSVEGLHLRRRTATRFLLGLGMSREQVKAIKVAISEGKEALAFARIDSFLNGIR